MKIRRGIDALREAEAKNRAIATFYLNKAAVSTPADAVVLSRIGRMYMKRVLVQARALELVEGL